MELITVVKYIGDKMDILLPEKIGSMTFLLLGIMLIVFRKKIAIINFKESYKNPTPKQIKDLKLAGQLKLEPVALKIQEVGCLIVGTAAIVICTQELFLPKAYEYVNSFMGFFTLSVICLGPAGFISYKLLPILNTKVYSYLEQKYFESFQKLNSSNIKEKLKAYRAAKKINDPLLHKLQKKAFVYAVILFIASYLMILGLFYVLIKITS